MGGAIDPNAIPLPSGWSVFAKGYLLRAVGLARYALTHVRSWCADSPIARVRLKGRIELLAAEVALLKEELRIKDARLAAIPARQRPHYLPQDRFAILVLKTARGWSFEVAARRFLVTAVTLATWTKRADEQDSTLVRPPRPINLFPPFVAEVIRSLKAVAPSMGAHRIADLLARAALHVGPTTVRRALRVPGKVSPRPEPPRKRSSTSARTIVAKRPNHVWNVDLTTIDTVLLPACFRLSRFATLPEPELWRAAA